ncbi:MAG: HAD-IIIC family phosphatase [Sulfuricella sp.]|nr:HAD-IIIC family phosphatase [Sulfuricella sp.]
MINKFIFSTSSTASELGKKFKEARSEDLQSRAKTKISVTVLANFSTQYLVNSIYTSLVFNGISPNIYEAPFDQWEFELNNQESETYRCGADYTLLLLSSTRIVFDRNKSASEFAIVLKDLLERYKEKSRSEIVLVLPESLREGFDQTSFFYRSVSTFRKELQRELENIVHIVDINPLIMEFGFAKWHPSKYLMSAKLCCHPNCFPLYGNYLASFIESLVRRPTRLVITDLDNTLWQGVVGDLGWEGVGLDRDSTGYPYLMLQNYLLSLKEAGVLLAICSKNSFELAKKVFDNRREMVLKFDDFVAYEINWEPKSENIQKILTELNLTSTGVLFLDDAKFEREEVKSNLPEVIVPELPENAEIWCEYLSCSGYLTVGKINKEDSKKSSMYIAERQRKEEAGKHADYSVFLKNLNLAITPEKVTASNFDRVFELIHKTNQFNLTTKRLTRGELEGAATRENSFCYCYRLKDKYSDYGIISVFIAEKTSKDWEIDNWLMSCRTIGRGVENFVFNHFLSMMLSDGDIVTGKYVASDKNNLVATLLGKMGFSEDVKTGVCTFTVGRCRNPAANYIIMSKPA